MIDHTIQDKLSGIVAAYPGKCAIEYGDIEISYSQMDKKSSILAGYLVRSGVPRGSLIGILLDNKVELIFAILGILKAGCVFVPLDPSYPDKRLRDMLVSTQTILVFSNRHRAARLGNILLPGNKKVEMISIEELVVDENDLLPFNALQYLPHDMIYIYFTSGTTGKPKAIGGQNKGLLHFINWEIETFGITEEFRISQFTPQCHDPFLRDIFVPLCTGGTICIPSGKEIILETNSMINWIEKSAVNLIHCTPGLFRVFNSIVLTGQHFQQLKYILLAGEKIIPGELTKWYERMGERIQLVNIYGPTETTLAKLFYLINEDDINKKNKTIPIGKPISGAKAIILTKDMEICGQGEIGEIFIRTPYRTAGYLNEPTLTHSKFIQNPFNRDPNDLIYGTGDLGRLLPDGNIEFMGRTDRQVKIRGFRVELSEIEKRLLEDPDITGCIVDFREDDTPVAAELRLCKKCGLPSSYPGTSYRDDGICNICQFYENNKQKADAYFKTTRDLQHLFEMSKPRKQGEYDCLLLYSGGKDSTYVLYQLKDMGLDILAYTFDNGFISPKALENIKTIVKELNVDHVIETSEKMDEIFREGLKTENSVCNCCFKVLRRKSTTLAYEKGIQYIVTGFSRGQIYDLRLYDIFYKMNIFDEKTLEEKILEERLLYHSQRDYVTDILGDAGIDKSIIMNVGLIDFFRYSAVSKEEILEFLKQRSSHWYNPGDTGFCSSNCLINDVGIHMQRKNYRYDNYTFPNSWEVRTGHMSLAEANREFASEIDVIKVERILKKLGGERDYNNDEQVNASSGGFLAAYYVSGKDIATNQLKEHLREKLPGYMIPPYFVRLEKIPLTPNKKIDYNALPDPRKHLDKEYSEPKNELERRLAQIWCDILGVERVSVEENFLQVGGHSLNLMNLISRVYKEFEVEIPLGNVFYDSSLRGIARYIQDALKEPYSLIAPTEKKEYYPLSSGQKRIYTIQQMDMDGTSINLIQILKLEGEVDIERLAAAFRKLVKRHESFRTSFQVIDSQPVQKIWEKVPFELEFYEPGSKEPDGAKSEVDTLIKNFVRPFEPEQAPLMRVALIKSHEYLMVTDVHHLVSDGLSQRIVMEDFIKFYADEELPPLQVQYKDYCQWLASDGQGERLKRQETYWLKEFDTRPPPLTLPFQSGIAGIADSKGNSREFCIEPEDTEKLRKILSTEEVTLAMILLAIYYVLLAKYSHQEDMVIGITASARPHSDLEKVVGMFVNMLPVRAQPMENETFIDFLKEVRHKVLNAYENQDYPYEELIKRLKLHRTSGKDPLMDAVFTMHNLDNRKEMVREIGKLKVVPHQYESPNANFVMALEVQEGDDNISLNLIYAALLFTESTARLMTRHYIEILKTIIAGIDTPIKDIKLSHQLVSTKRDLLLEDNKTFNFN